MQGKAQSSQQCGGRSEYLQLSTASRTKLSGTKTRLKLNDKDVNLKNHIVSMATNEDLWLKNQESSSLNQAESLFCYFYSILINDSEAKHRLTFDY